MIQLVELHVHGSSRSWVQRLPESMSRLRRLRTLQIRDVRMNEMNHVLAELTGLKQLKIYSCYSMPEHALQPPNPLPPDMHMLRGLRQLHLSCNYQPMPALALPALTKLYLVEPTFDSEVCAVH